MALKPISLPIDPEALSRAIAAAEHAAESSDDGGSCNLDSTVIRLAPGKHVKPLVQQLTAAGLYASKTRWLGNGAMVCNSGGGQGNKRMRWHEAFQDSLRESGIKITPFCMMD